VAKTLKEAMTSDHKGLKVIIAEGECQLERQRKLGRSCEKMQKGRGMCA
jgi:TPP-dependent indolepyruvate ferredoxin oxidoreductase alpha subunit